MKNENVCLQSNDGDSVKINYVYWFLITTHALTLVMFNHISPPQSQSYSFTSLELKSR